ncbi:unnamed protein product [Moneuplotes crassus]|uniref:Uncharacterized protein n=1 Tax=Euplotes crassus TaxID=5936 RepID=A0AAD1XQP2_EUPCR|nr:unnamed protein product [Moneuplotes crassus]
MYPYQINNYQCKMNFKVTLKLLGNEILENGITPGGYITPGGPTPGGPTPGGPETTEICKQEENLHILAKNQDNLDEYEVKTDFNPEHFLKLQKWTNNGKYEIEEVNKNMIKLTIEVCTFYLKKNNKTNNQLIRGEITDLKKSSDTILRDIKLFNYYFLNHWKEKYRIMMKEKEFIRSPCIDNPQNLYNLTDGVGFSEENDQMDEKTFYIGFKQPLHVHMNGKGYNLKHLKSLSDEERKTTAFINGKGKDYDLVEIDSVFSHKMMIEGHPTPYYMHRVATPVMIKETYEVLTPKTFF